MGRGSHGTGQYRSRHPPPDAQLRQDLDEWAARYDATLNPAVPQDSPGFASEADERDFNATGWQLARRVAEELKERYAVYYFDQDTRETVAVHAKIAVSDYPLFSGLCGSWLHQDWDLEDPDVYTVVDRFLEHEPADAAPRLIEEVERLRVALSDRTKAQASSLLFRTFECNYYPTGADLTVDAWLVNLRDRAAAPR